MQFRTGVKIAVLVGLVVLAIAPMAETGGISTTTFAVTDDSTDGTTFYLGDVDASADGDIDTSIAYDSRFWDDLTVSVKSAPNFKTSDSGACKFYLQQSNDGTYWTTTDSIVVVDSLAGFKDMAPQKYKWSRFTYRGHLKTSNGMVAAILTATAWGRY